MSLCRCLQACLLCVCQYACLCPLSLTVDSVPLALFSGSQLTHLQSVWAVTLPRPRFVRLSHPLSIHRSLGTTAAHNTACSWAWWQFGFFSCCHCSVCSVRLQLFLINKQDSRQNLNHKRDKRLSLLTQWNSNSSHMIQITSLPWNRLRLERPNPCRL